MKETNHFKSESFAIRYHKERHSGSEEEARSLLAKGTYKIGPPKFLMRYALKNGQYLIAGDL